ncbi:MAG: ATP-grasp domain-containing protein [Spirochaetia bacterium]
MPYLMILGAGTMQIPAIIAAKELGLKVIVADGSTQAPAISMCDEFVHIDLKDHQKLARYAKQFQVSHTLSGVFTAGTDFSASVAYIAQACQLPGHSYESTLRATNKQLMRECFLKHHIPSPQFLAINTHTPFDSIMAYILEWSEQKFPKLVVKPIDNMGARGVIFVENINALPQAIEHALSYSPCGNALIEEFIDGPEISIDALVFNGKIVPCGIADRHIFYPPYFIEMGHTLPSTQPQNIIEEVISVFSAAIRAMGLTHGAAKGDIKISSDGVKIGEIAARLSGGYMSGWTFPYASGINLTKNAIQLAIGQQPETLTSKPLRKFSAEWSFISIPGLIAEVLYQDEARTIPHIVECFVRVKKGQRVYFPENNVQKCGNFIACHSHQNIAKNAVFTAVKTIVLRLEPHDDATKKFLFESTWPGASCIEGCDFNGLTTDEIKQRFALITGANWQECIDFDSARFDTALRRGGLQGALWFYDTYIVKD